jgi:DMSO/TMAO reductase YedYZ molybdopterin-dependent catalytic subunit
MRRREFLTSVARGAAASVVLGCLPGLARNAFAAPAGLIERADWPEHWETTLAALGRSWITPNARFFVRSHFPVPTIDPARWRLEVTGLVRRPLSLTLDELRAMQSREVAHTLECAGNGRGLFHLPSTSGTQWERGAVGNARWGGVSLADLLARAEVSPEAKHVWFEAADHAPLPSAPPFLRSIPVDRALAGGTMLAHRMNGAPLPVLHGAPLRVIVPGWFGMASTKWVTRVRVEAAPSDNHFMIKGYRYTYPGEDPVAAASVQELRVKSVITRPLAGARVAPGVVHIEGFAWAGSAGVERVEISTDDGGTWRPATLIGDRAPQAWRAWRAGVAVPRAGTLTVMARATDVAGETQPMDARANAGGYGNNSIHRVSVRVGA